MTQFIEETIKHRESTVYPGSYGASACAAAREELTTIRKHATVIAAAEQGLEHSDTERAEAVAFFRALAGES